MKVLGLLKENAGVNVVALTPDNVKHLSEHYTVIVESGAGVLAGFTDEAYGLAGAEIESDRALLLKKSSLLITLSSKINFSGIEKHKTVIGGYGVLDELESILQFTNNPIDFFSLSLLPRITKAQSMDILSSLAALSGYQAVVHGFDKSMVVSPMISSAGGTLYPAKVLVLGAGVAGLQAIATARRLGAVVTAFDIRKQTKTEVESLGADFIEVMGAVEDESSGGYAIEQDENFMTKVIDSIALQAKDADLIITTARIPGKKAPKLITADMLKRMKPGSIVIDMAADTGGNCEFSENNKTVLKDGVFLLGESTIYNRVARSASILLGNNMTTFIHHFRSNEDLTFQDEILAATLVTRNGKIVHEKICAEVNKY
ncbi:NAD(P) transhydrogenase subunit alpha [Putridiphycobacter roseus]|uniref:proton-translocating NAD(P)(+) transhydrogenase n=1 Tax=Putridiphycobacter roseus TaxID=2219161 RepID=A0A2W1NLN0_9FLAO|nr:NAD(P) transhydrogenase subunit alpha [Putridiphycobacter roseus]PZE18746.1 NAD(P) transhydrogenase subunit alpha [Putridiphycobacter roseus]